MHRAKDDKIKEIRVIHTVVVRIDSTLDQDVAKCIDCRKKTICQYVQFIAIKKRNANSILKITQPFICSLIDAIISEFFWGGHAQNDQAILPNDKLFSSYYFRLWILVIA